MSQEITLPKQSFVERAKAIHSSKYDYSKVDYRNNRTKILIKCPSHGEFWQTPSSHLSGKGCKKCGLEKLSALFKLSLSDFVIKANQIHNGKYDYTFSFYKNTHAKIQINCPEHGKFWQAPSAHLRGAGCKKCSLKTISSKRACTTEEFIKKARKIHGNLYLYDLTIYKNAIKKVLIICKEHGVFKQKPSYHLSGNGCQKCGLKSRSEQKRLDIKKFTQIAKKIHNNKYDYSKVKYINSQTKITIICPTHGEFRQTPNSHTQGSGCKKCKFNETAIEKSIERFLKKSHINFKKNRRDIIAPKELDFYLPTKKIAIECNGVFWHSELKGKDRHYHLNKTSECSKKGISLIHIFENEFKNKPKIIISQLKNILGLNKYKILARKCRVEEVDATTKSKFLNKYHIQGQDKSSIKLGLFYKNKMVAVMTFCKNCKAKGKKNTEWEWELSRFATISNFSVVGGAGKLLKHFESNWQPKKITSYADRKWPQGDFYKKLGFTKVRESKPNYWYFKHDPFILYHRFNFRKSELPKKLQTFDPNKTEWENMKENGWNRIWDCGSLTFEKVKSS